MSRQIVKQEVITPAIAAEYLKTNKCNRPVRQALVDYYADQMKRGLWKENGDTICFEEETGYMIDGQHRLKAIIKSGVSLNMLVARNCEKGSFVTIDVGFTRRDSDIFAIAGVSNACHVAAIVTKYMMLHWGSMIISGSANAPNILKRKKFTKEDKLNEYFSSPELYNKASAAASRMYSKLKLLKTSEVGSMIVYLIKDKLYSSDEVISFFDQLFYGENITNKTISLLRDKLFRDSLSNKKMTGAYKQALIIKTWNAYIAGKELSILKWNEITEEKPKFI